MSDDQNHVPSWVPEFAPGVHADVYPVEPKPDGNNDIPAELSLNRGAVIHGYSEHRQPFEFSSCLPAQFSDIRNPSPLSSAPASEIISSSASASTSNSYNRSSAKSIAKTISQVDLPKLKSGLATLRRSRPAKLQRMEQIIPQLPNPSAESRSSFPPSAKKTYPLQKPLSSSSLEDWFNKLASNSTSSLSPLVPLGPAIVRAAGKVIEMMALRNVPTQRGAWYIRVAVINECAKQILPDRSPPCCTNFWTGLLCSLLKTEITAIRSRKTAMLGTMQRPKFWEYVLDLARWQEDEALLDTQMWISQIAAVLRTELVSSQTFAAPGTKIATMAAWKFLPEFIATPENARMLCDALLPGTNFILKGWKMSINSNRDQNTARGGKNTVKKNVKKTPWVQDRCHVEVAQMLQIGLSVLDNSVDALHGELNLMILEKLVKKGVDIVVIPAKKGVSLAKKIASAKEKKDSTNATKSTWDGQRLTNPIDKRKNSHYMIREFETLSTHGDVAQTITALRGAHQSSNGLQEQINQLCNWVIEGPVCDRSEAICVCTAVLLNLSETTRTATAASRIARPTTTTKRVKRGIHHIKYVNTHSTEVYSLHRELWEFIKNYSRERKPENLEEDTTFVKFIAQLCRVEMLSLPTFVRDIGNLSSFQHPGAPYLVKALSLLPDPVDKSIADSRRSLLSKFGFDINRKSPDMHDGEEKMLQAVYTADMKFIHQNARELIERGDIYSMLSITESLRVENVSQIEESGSALHQKVFARASFFLAVEEAAVCVEWVIDNLSDVIDPSVSWSEKNMTFKRSDAGTVLIRLLEDLSRYIAASGHLEITFLLLRKAWMSTWATKPMRQQILHTCAAFGRTFTPKSGTRSMYWTKVVFKYIRQGTETSTEPNKITLLALAALRGIELERGVREPPLPELMDTSNKENWGMSPEEDLATCLARNQIFQANVFDLRSQFTESPSEFPVESFFLQGITGNDIFASIFTPKLADALAKQRSEPGVESLFSTLAIAVLNVIEERQTDVRLQSVRPTVLIDFIAVLVAGCISDQIDPSVTLEVLIGIKWVKRILAPSAGIILGRRLRSRVDAYVSKFPHDKVELSQLLFNMVTRFTSEEARDEVQVSKALELEPFGMIEMQLSLLATHRKEGGQEEEFGSRIGDAAIMLLRDSAQMLAITALRCCTDEESRHVVAGLVGYDAAKAMVESLNFVVTGLTAEAQKNSTVNRKRAEQWAQVDTARRGILECIVGSLSQEVGVQVEAVLFDQLVTATTQLETATEKQCLPSSLLEDGRHISEAIESRLECILRSQRTPQTAEMWRQRTIQIATLLKTGVPVFRHGAITAAANVLALCLRHLGEGGRDESSSTPTPLQQVLERGPNRDVKRQLELLLTPTLLWIPPPEREAMSRLIPRGISLGSNGNVVKAYKVSGEEINSWVLTEGFGRYVDEEAPVNLSNFGKQGGGRFEEETAPVVQLKRTYSSFASLAV